MSAAHELSIRGFEVDVYEKNHTAGGKARSFNAPGAGKAARMDLPAEHGFRFFPGFYQHVPDTMKRIPVDGGGTVFDNLVEGKWLQIARSEGKSEFFAPAGAADSPVELWQAIKFLWTYAHSLGVDDDLSSKFMRRAIQLMTSCEERLEADQEKQSWWEFSGAQDTDSDDYGKYFADGITRTMVAAKADEISARTAGSIMLQIGYDLTVPGRHLDHVLNGPTNDAWLIPWRTHLEHATVERGAEKQKVTFHTGTTVTALHCSKGRITGATVTEHGAAHDIAADYYVAAVPVGAMRALVTEEIKDADARLRCLDKLEQRWMNGVMFYLRDEAKIVNGHTVYIDSPWAVTSISQGQFWDGGNVDLASCSGGAVRDILSVDVSDWDTPGLCGKPAKSCSAAEVKAEVWNQITAHLNDDPEAELRNVAYVDAVVDPAIEFRGGQVVKNSEPLLINKAGTWTSRPEACPEAGTEIENLFIASDYVKTNTDLATMEGANEAARRAVTGILQAEGIDSPKLFWPLRHPEIVDFLRGRDLHWYKKGKPHRLRWWDPARLVGIKEVTFEDEVRMMQHYLEQDASSGDLADQDVIPVG